MKEINESVYSLSLNLQLFFLQSYRYRVDNKYFIVEITVENTTVQNTSVQHNDYPYLLVEKWNE